MKMIKKKSLVLFLTLIFMVMAALLLIMVIPVIMATTEKNVESKDIVLDDRWTVTVNDKVYKDVTLSKFRFDMCDRGDILTFEHVIPRYDTTDDPTINLYSGYHIRWQESYIKGHCREKVQPCDINVSYSIWCDNNDFIDAYAEKLGKLYTDILYSNVFISGRVLDIVQYGSDRVFCTGSSGKDIYGIYDILCSAAAV